MALSAANKFSLRVRRRKFEGDNTRLSQQIHQQNGAQKGRQNETEDREVNLQEVCEGQRRLEKQVHYMDMVHCMVNNRGGNSVRYVVYCMVHCRVHCGVRCRVHCTDWRNRC